MTGIEIRNATEDDLADYVRAMNAAFGFTVRDGDIEFRRTGIDYDRAPCAFADGQLVGTARSFATPLTLPGLTTVDVAAVTNVGVLPTHRRQGALTGMMKAQLDDVAARGEPAAILIASEAPIYERFGYGCVTRHAIVRLESAAARFSARPAAADDVRFVDLADIEAVARPVYERHRVSQPGAIGRPDRWWKIFTGKITVSYDREKHQLRMHVVCGDAGWCSYTVKEQWDDDRLPHGTIEVSELVAATPDAYAALWHHLLSVDLVGTVVAQDRPPVEPVPLLLTDRRRAVQRSVADFMWARLLDVPAALSARTYSADGALVLQVVDEFRPSSGGRFALSVDDGVGVCAPVDGEPDLVLRTADLAAAWLGGTPLWPASDAGRVDSRTAGSVERFDRMFLTARPPWCNTWF